MQNKFFIAFLLAIVLGAGCQKQNDWLDIKVTRSDLVPERLEDYQALLDADVMVQGYTYLGNLGTDHYYVSDADYMSVSLGMERNSYRWAKEIYESIMPPDWDNAYAAISVANICLEGVSRLTPVATNLTAFNRVRGTALFFRGLAYYHLLQIFSPTYNASSAGTDMGVPLRLTADVNDRPGRSSVAQVYGQILSDLGEAEGLLPVTAAFKNRPSKITVQAMMAKVYLMMEQWGSAEQFASAVLSGYSTLIDFNTLNATAAFPFPTLQNGHPEVIFYAEGTGSTMMSSNRPITDSNLFRSYAANDLRKTVYYRQNLGLPIFKGSHTGRATPYAGISTNELYLIHAEAAARQGKTGIALQSLNTLLVKRWKTGTFTAVTANSALEALGKILPERKKELPFTGNIGWEDLRRLNKDPQFARTVTRRINGVLYTLAPGDPRWVYPIPDSEILLTGIPQNIR